MEKREVSEEKCPKCGHKLVKPPKLGFVACVNPNCENYPVWNFMGKDNR